MSKIKVGVIGVGRMGKYHVGILSELPEVELTTVVDIDSKSRKVIEENYGTPSFENYKDIYGKVDAAVVAVPTRLHFPIAKDLLNAGIHVLLEKPCANNLDHARELFQIAEDKALILHVGHVERFNGAVQELHKIVDSPVFVECKRTGPFTDRIILNLIQSRVTKTFVLGSSIFSTKDDLVNAQLEFENGCIANIVASRASQNQIRTLSVTQKDSFVVLDYTDQEIYVHRQSSSEHKLSKDSLRYKQESLVERIFVHKDNPLKLELKHFLDCVTNGSPRKVAIDNELYSLEVALNILSQFKSNL